MKNINPVLLVDGYKTSHREQYPEGTECVYSTWTPRSGKYLDDTKNVVCFGTQGMIKRWLIDYFNDNFFNIPKEEVINEYKRVIKSYLFQENPYTKHLEELHDLGYLPIKIKSLPEGMKSPIRVPNMTIENTDKRFFWLTNYLETLISNQLWKPMTSATIADSYRTVLEKFALETTGSIDFVQFQGHDFSMRGMSGIEASELSGVGHLTSFVGSDTIPAIMYLEKYYGADSSKELIACSVPATEHSVMCAGGVDDEFETYRRLIEDVYPSGIVSIVSDTWDLWHVLTDTIPKLKESIMKRDGKVVIRPDSGDPVDIICGIPWPKAVGDEAFAFDMRNNSEKGVIELLWDTFGGTVNALGYKELDPHIGAIYGDSITIERAISICSRLKSKGFASTNIVFGIGSFTYSYNTRDSLGFAVKSTHVVINCKENNIFKNPITDDGTKKSQTGRVVVVQDQTGINFIDGLSIEEETAYDQNLLQTVFENGKMTIETTLYEIRERIRNS